MSQEKVDQYKEAKKNRKQELEKQKKQKALKKMLYIALGILVAAALIVGIVITIINTQKQKRAAYDDSVKSEEFILNDLTGLQEDDDE